MGTNAVATQDAGSESRARSLVDYGPLVALIAVSAAVAAAIASAMDATGAGGLRVWMHPFMGFFLCSLAMLKLYDPPGFADGFVMYDVVAKRLRAWAYVYPFVELGLGLAYFAFVAPVFVYVATIAVMAVGAIGVVLALRDGIDIECPCMGSVLKVPLSTVTLTEDVGMGAMAAIMLGTALA